MATKFASERRAWGLCDRCGQRYRLLDLKTYTIMGRRINSRVCPPCWDLDHPQNFVTLIGAQKVANDPQALRNPRPDTNLDASRGLFAWSPTATQQVSFVVNRVYVTIT